MEESGWEGERLRQNEMWQGNTCRRRRREGTRRWENKWSSRGGTRRGGAPENVIPRPYSRNNVRPKGSLVLRHVGVSEVSGAKGVRCVVPLVPPFQVFPLQQMRMHGLAQQGIRV